MAGAPLDTAPSAIGRWLDLRPSQRAPFGRLLGQATLLGLTLVSYYSVANSQFLSVWGASSVPWTYIAAAAATVGGALAFSAAEQRVGLRTAAVTTLALLGTALALIWLGLATMPGQRGVAFVAPVAFRMLWVLGNLTLWSQANALLDLQQVKRLTPVLTLGFVLGILTWGLFNESVVRSVGTTPIVALDGLLLGIAAVLAGVMPPAARPSPPAERDHVRLGPAARRFVTTLLLYDAIATAGAYAVDYAFLTAVQDRYPERTDSAVFLGRYMGGMTLAVLLVTATLSGPVLRRFGIGGGLAANPLGVALAGGSALAGLLLGAPDLAIFGLVVLAKGSNETAVPTFTGPAVRTAVQALPATHRVRVLSWYDGVVAPLAVGTTGVVLLGVRALGGAGLATILWILVGLLALWAGATVVVARGYPALLAERLRPTRAAVPPLGPGDTPLDELSSPAALLALRVRRHAAAPAPLAALRPGLRHPDPAVRAKVARACAAEGPAARPAIEDALDVERAPAVRAALLLALAAVAEGAADRRLVASLDAAEPAERDAALGALLGHGGAAGAPAALAKLAELRASPLASLRLAQVLALAGRAAYAPQIEPLLADRDPAVRAAALRAVAACRAASLVPVLVRALDRPDTAPAARAALLALGPLAVPSLAHGAAQGDLTGAARALRLLGRRRAPQVAPALLAAAERPELRPVALDLLAARGPSDPFPALTSLVEQQRAFARLLLEHGGALAEPSARGRAVGRACRQAALGLLALATCDGRPELRRPAEVLAGRRPGERALALEAAQTSLPDDLGQLLAALLAPPRAPRAPSPEVAAAALSASPLASPLLRAALGPPTPSDGPAHMSKTWETALALLANPDLAALDDDGLALLAASARERSFAAGEALVREGDPAGPVYVLVRGAARVERAGTPIRGLGPGDLFGELDLFEAGPRAADVVATEAGMALTLEADVLADLLDEQPALARAFLADLTRRLRGA